MRRLKLIGRKTIGLKLIKFLSLIVIIVFASCKHTITLDREVSELLPCQVESKSATVEAIEDGLFKAHKATTPIEIDGCSKDETWSDLGWYGMNYLWMGNKVDGNDYHGKFKLTWDSDYLYILVEVIDDTLNPTLVNGVENYWKGDYVEVFIDEDKSGGNHKFNHQAFAYHVSTEGHAIDKNTLEETVFFDDHITVMRSQDGNTYVWEMAIKLFDKQFDESTTDNRPVKINTGKTIGFSMAYGDNDGNNSREHFIGSKKTHGNNNDEGYVNSDVFGAIVFAD